MTATRKWLYLVMWSLPGKDGLHYEWSALDVAGWAELSAQMHRMWTAGHIADYIVHHFDPSSHQPLNSRSVLACVNESLAGKRTPQKRLKKASVNDKSIADKIVVPVVPDEPFDAEPETEKPVSDVPDNPDYF